MLSIQWIFCILLLQAARDDSMEIIDDWIDFLSTKGGEVRRRKLDEMDEYGMAAIHYAAKFNRYKILLKLCENGAGKQNHLVTVLLQFMSTT